MRRSGHDIEAFLALQQTQRVAIEVENVMVQPSDNQQRRRLDMSKGLSGKVGAASARDDSSDRSWFVRRGDERRGGARAGPEQANRKSLDVTRCRRPANGFAHARTEQGDIENVAPILFFTRREEIEQQGREATVGQLPRHERIARAETGGAAAMREDDQSSRPPWEAQNSFEPARLDQNVDRFRIFSHGATPCGEPVDLAVNSKWFDGGSIACSPEQYNALGGFFFRKFGEAPRGRRLSKGMDFLNV
jgi:hypothetical protein